MVGAPSLEGRTGFVVFMHVNRTGIVLLEQDRSDYGHHCLSNICICLITLGHCDNGRLRS